MSESQDIEAAKDAQTTSGSGGCAGADGSACVCDCGGIGEVCECPECGWKGCDIDKPRVCEIDAHDEPEGDDHGQYCAECDCQVWWLPKCPECGCGCNWTYQDDPEVHPPNAPGERPGQEARELKP